MSRPRCWRQVDASSGDLPGTSPACEKRCGLRPPLVRCSAITSAPRSLLSTAATTGGSFRPALALTTYAPKPTAAAAAAITPG